MKEDVGACGILLEGVYEGVTRHYERSIFASVARSEALVRVTVLDMSPLSPGYSMYKMKCSSHIHNTALLAVYDEIALSTYLPYFLRIHCPSLLPSSIALPTHNNHPPSPVIVEISIHPSYRTPDLSPPSTYDQPHYIYCLHSTSTSSKG